MTDQANVKTPNAPGTTDGPEHGRTWVATRHWKGLPLTIDEVIARYLRHIADGPECAEYLRACCWPSNDPATNKHDIGFDSWHAMWRWSHQRLDDEGCLREWDARDYTADEMRLIYDGIIQHASRDGRSS